MANIASRGTTPTVAVEVDQDLSEFDVYATISQGAHIVTHNKDVECTPIKTGCMVYFTLTQEETLEFSAGRAHIQIRAVNTEDVCVATTICEVYITDVLLDGVIPQVV